MKKFLMTFFAIMMVIPFHCLNAFARLDGEDTEIIVIPGDIPDTPIPNRTIIPISAYYDYSAFSVVVSFSSYLGSVETTIVNIDSGESYEEMIDAYYTPVYIPIAGSAGMYTVNFALPDGYIYYGRFVL